MPYPELLDRLLPLALERHARERRYATSATASSSEAQLPDLGLAVLRQLADPQQVAAVPPSAPTECLILALLERLAHLGPAAEPAGHLLAA